MKPKALLFDVFGTCVDWRRGIASAVGTLTKSRHHSIDAYAFAESWRSKYQPAMEEIRSGRRGYVDLEILHYENLLATLPEFGLQKAFDDDELEKLNSAWERLPPWPDTVPGLLRLKQYFIIAPCSNGSIALMTRLAKHAGMPWDCILGAGVARAYKPNPAAYRRSCEALRLEPRDVMMVAAHNDDLAAARATGMQTAFIPRPTEHGPEQTTDLRHEQDWDIVASDVAGIADRLQY